MDIFIGGGGDDLSWLGLGVVRRYAEDYCAETGRPVAYVPNARPWRLRRLLKSSGLRHGPVNLVGHSWGAVDAFEAAAWAACCGLAVANLITLDPVSGPWRRPSPRPGARFWLNVALDPSRPDSSDRLAHRTPFAHTPSRLPVDTAHRTLVLDLNHRDVASMMRLSGARERLERSWAGVEDDGG